MTAGERPPFRLQASVFLAALAWAGLNFAWFFRGANTWEFANYAEIGRNLLTGHGFSTRVLDPSTIAFLRARGLATTGYAPVIHRFPLPALLSALSQAALGSNDLGSVSATLALFAFWVAAVHAAAYRWLGRRRALAAAALFAAVPAGLKYFALFNLPDIPFGALLFLFHWRLAEMDGREGAGRLALLGALGGLLYLCRQNFWIWLPLYGGYLGWLLPPARRGRGLAAFAGAFAVLALPAVWYNLRWFGSMQTPDVAWNLAHGVMGAEQPWLSFRTYDAAAILRERWPAVIAKSLDRLHTLILEGPTLWQLQALIPFLALGLLRWPRGAARRFVLLSGAALAVQVAAFAPLRFDSWGLGVGYRYLFWSCPALILLGVHGLAEFARSLGRRWRAPALAAWLLVELGFLFPFYTHDLTAIHLQHPSGQPPERWPELAWLREHCPADEAVVSNIPAQVSWYAGRPAIAMTNDPEELPQVLAASPARYLLVSTINIGTLGDLPRWLDLLRPDPSRLKAYCGRHRYRVAAMFPGALLVDLRPTR